MNAWREWEKRQREKIIASLPKSASSKAGKEPVTKRPITEEELFKLKQLRGVSTAWGSGDSRFIRQFESASPETQISERQAWYINVLCYKYRKQLKINPPKPAGYGV